MGKFFKRQSVLHRPIEILRARSMLWCAAGICMLYLVAHLAGLRAFTCILNGTIESAALGWKTSELLALAYIFIYLAFVLLVPVLVLAAMMLMVWEKCRK